MNTQYTPEPYRVIKKETEIEVRLGDVGTLDSCIVLGPNREANAALIAAAPALLEALQTIKTFLESSAGNPCPSPIRRLVIGEAEITINKAIKNS